MSARGYDGGAGGKFRKTPFRRPHTTPYDRPPTALRPSQAAPQSNDNKNGWFSKLVDPASKLITYGAHKLFSSVFRKRLLPPPSPTPAGELDENTETRDVNPQSTTAVIDFNAEELTKAGNNDASKVSGVAELEAMLKQKTFTRSEIDHLTTLLLSRTEDNSFGVQKEGPVPNTSNLQASFDDTHEKLAMPRSQGNRIEHAAISTPAIKSKVLEEDAASPAELAKAYMGNRSAKVSPLGLSFQSQMPGEGYSTPYKSPLNLKSPATSLQKPVSDNGTENGFLTPRFRGRSAIYSMARTPYSRMHKSTGFKASETAVRLPLSINENKQFNESQKQPLKRRSSVLDNDIGSVGPIRRIRQKPNLVHPKTLTLPPVSGGPRAAYGSGPLLDVPQLPAPSGLSSLSHTLSKSVADNSKPSTSSAYVPSESIEMAQKIFQQLDKFTPKGKSLDLKTDTGGSSHHGTGTLKILNNIQDNQKENGAVDFVDAYALSKTPKTVEEAGPKKSVITIDNSMFPSRAEDKVPASYSSRDSKITSHPGFDHPQRKQAFQMSAHEDYLELDDDVHLNVTSAPSGESNGNTKLPNKSSAIPDSTPAKEPIPEKTVVPEPPKSSDSLSSKEEAKSLVDGPVTTKTVGFTFPVGPSTSSSNSMAIAESKSADHEKFATLSKPTINATSAFNVKSDQSSPFPFAMPSSATGMAVRDTKLEVANSSDPTVAKASQPSETDKKSTQEPVDGGLKKPQDDASSPPVSSAKGIFNFGSPANNATPGTLSSPVPSSTAPSLGLFSSISSANNQSTPPLNLGSSPSLFSSSSGLSNGFATSSSMSSLSSGPSFQFGSSTSSVTFGSSASLAAENLGSKATSGDTPGCNLGTKSPESAPGGGTAISELGAPSKAPANEAQPAGSGTGSLFGFQASSTPGFPTQSISFGLSGSTSGLSGSTSLSSGASSFGAASPAVVGPTFNATSSSLGVSSLSPINPSSGSGTTSSIFGSSWQPSSNPTFPASTTFGATSSPSTGFSLGGSSSNGNNSSILFGSSSTTTSNSSLSSGAPFVFGSSSSSSASTTPFVFGPSPTSSSSSSSLSASSSPFVFSSSSSSTSAPMFSFSSSITTTTSSPTLPQPVFGNNNASTPTFGFGSTSTAPSGNNDQMTMEDTMAEDSMQAPTPTAIFGQSPISAAPSGGFVFGAAPAPSPSPGGFMGGPPSGNPFQFGSSQPNQMPSQNPSLFQPSNSVEFHAGSTGSFSLGSGGGDKANRRIVKVKSKIRRK